MAPRRMAILTSNNSIPVISLSVPDPGNGKKQMHVNVSAARLAGATFIPEEAKVEAVRNVLTKLQQRQGHQSSR